jgi:hypothetical protein
MSEMRQKQTSGVFRAMSALLPKADIGPGYFDHFAGQDKERLLKAKPASSDPTRVQGLVPTAPCPHTLKLSL